MSRQIERESAALFRKITGRALVRNSGDYTISTLAGRILAYTAGNPSCLGELEPGQWEDIAPRIAALNAKGIPA